MTSRITNRSPASLPGRPLPLTRNFRPCPELAGIERSMSPEGTGTFTLPPKPASQGVTGKVR